MSARLKKEDEIELARKFLDHVCDMIEDGDDTVYEMLDPECKYGDKLLRRLNNDTIREILALGFKAKYGEDWHEPVRKRWPRPARWAGVEYHYAVCSKCGGQVPTGFEATVDAVAGWSRLYPFCPHCGTPMRSSEYDGPGASMYRRWKAVGGKEGGDGQRG